MLRRLAARAAAAALLAACAPAPVRAQPGPVDGHASITADVLPHGRGATELRARIFLERVQRLSGRLKVTLSGELEGLLADRAGRVADAALRPHEAYLDVDAGDFDVRVGLATVVWGRLDEVQPTDVVNPLDVSRYLFEGRSDARLPVPLTRVRWFAGEHAAVEAVWLPAFRRGTFDRLDEAGSPFNLSADVDPCTQTVACPAVVRIRRDPPITLESSQAGVRVTATSGRVDWALTAFRGVRAFGLHAVSPALASDRTPVLLVTESFPRFTMVGGDLETVRGPWAIRGEIAAFLDDTMATDARPDGIEGRSLQAGVGADRRVGDTRVSASLLVERRDGQGLDDVNLSLVVGGDRGFARDTRRVRLFGAWNAADASGFVRTIGACSLRADLWLEGSIGWFFSDGDDTLSRFSTRDFVYVRLKRYF